MEKDWLQEQKNKGRTDKDIGQEVGLEWWMVGYHRRRFGIKPLERVARIKAALKRKYPNGRRGPLAANWHGGRMSTTGNKPGGYIRIYMPDHPEANRGGYVYEHRYVMQQKIGRLLKKGELVDHIDRNRSNNAPENLRLQPSRSAHVKDHFSARDQLTVVMKKLARYEELYGPLPEKPRDG